MNESVVGAADAHFPQSLESNTQREKDVCSDPSLLSFPDDDIKEKIRQLLM